jgi:hypothetical protein
MIGRDLRQPQHANAVAIARGNTEIINSNLRRSRIAAWE